MVAEWSIYTRVGTIKIVGIFISNQPGRRLNETCCWWGIVEEKRELPVFFAKTSTIAANICGVGLQRIKLRAARSRELCAVQHYYCSIRFNFKTATNVYFRTHGTLGFEGWHFLRHKCDRSKMLKKIETR